MREWMDREGGEEERADLWVGVRESGRRRKRRRSA